tara:strand:- start:105 stop:272 length:168 start_codon:yes stop_codon:yes gene_type:complete
MKMTIKDMAVEAIDEARILESGREEFIETRMLETAELLSGVPYFMVKDVYERISR